MEDANYISVTQNQAVIHLFIHSLSQTFIEGSRYRAEDNVQFSSVA